MNINFRISVTFPLKVRLKKPTFWTLPCSFSAMGPCIIKISIPSCSPCLGPYKVIVWFWYSSNKLIDFQKNTFLFAKIKIIKAISDLNTYYRTTPRRFVWCYFQPSIVTNNEVMVISLLFKCLNGQISSLNRDSRLKFSVNIGILLGYS